jgi:hypothetical protein
MSSPRKSGFSLSSFSRAELFVGAGCLLILISLFTSWLSADGASAVGAFHGAGFITLLAWLVVVVLFVIRSPLLRNTVEFPALPATDAVAFSIGGVVELVGLLIFLGQYHHDKASGISRHIAFGFILALVGSGLTIFGGASAVRGGRRVLHHDPSSPTPAAPAPPPRETSTPTPEGPGAGSEAPGAGSPAQSPLRPPPTPPPAPA